MNGFEMIVTIVAILAMTTVVVAVIAARSHRLHRALGGKLDAENRRLADEVEFLKERVVLLEEAASGRQLEPEPALERLRHG